MFNALNIQRVKDVCLAEHPRPQRSEGKPRGLLVCCSALLVVQPCCPCKAAPHRCCSELEIIPWTCGLHRAFGWGRTAGALQRSDGFVSYCYFWWGFNTPGTGVLLFRTNSMWCWNTCKCRGFFCFLYILLQACFQALFFFLHEECRKSSSMVLLSLLSTRPHNAPFLRIFLAEFTLSNFSCLYLILILN